MVESSPVPGECCNKSVVVACKGNDQTYKVGETWIEDNNYCVTFECVKDNEALAIKELVTTCNTTCSLGFEYEPAGIDEAKCCGSCKQSQCVVDGILREVGQVWQSVDYCDHYKCSNDSGLVSKYKFKKISRKISI